MLAAPVLPFSSVVPAAPAVSVSRPLFRPFASSVSASAPSAPVSDPAPSVATAPSRGPPGVPSVAVQPPPFTLGKALDELPEDEAPDVLPRDSDPLLHAGVADSFLSEFRRMLPFIVDLFPQAAGSPSVSPPLRALFEDFFAFSSVPLQPIFLNWFERVRTALADADSRMAASLATGRLDFSFILSCSPTYAVHGDFVQGHAVPLNPLLLSLFERSLKLLLLLGISIREATALEASFHTQSEALSHLMWVRSGLLSLFVFRILLLTTPPCSTLLLPHRPRACPIRPLSPRLTRLL